MGGFLSIDSEQNSEKEVGYICHLYDKSSENIKI